MHTTRNILWNGKYYTNHLLLSINSTLAHIKMYLGNFLHCSDKCILSTVQTRATGDSDESDRSEKVIQTNQLNFVKTEWSDNWNKYNVFQQLWNIYVMKNFCWPWYDMWYVNVENISFCLFMKSGQYQYRYYLK